MAFKKSFAPSVANSSNVKGLRVYSSGPIDDGTAKSNAVAKKDLAFWIPQAAPLLREGIKRVQTLDELLKLPKAHIAHVLATILPIYRQRRKINGKRYTNASLKLKVEAWQRVIRDIFQEEYTVAVLSNPHAEPRMFNLYSDPQLKVLVQVLDNEMQLSAQDGLTLGLKKRTRSVVTPADLKRILQL